MGSCNACAAYKADNLCAILDKKQIAGHRQNCRSIPDRPIIPKFESFGWNVIEIDGHNMGEIIDALDAADTVKGKPTVIVAKNNQRKRDQFAENVVGFP